MANKRDVKSTDIDRIRPNDEDIDSIQSELSDIDMQISALEQRVIEYVPHPPSDDMESVDLVSKPAFGV